MTWQPQKTGNAFRRFCMRTCTLLYVLGCIQLVVSRPAQALDPQPPASVPLPTGASAWNLILNDNFDGAAYDTSFWNPYANWGGNGSFNSGREKYYPSQIRVADGICNLVAEPNAGATTFVNSYKSGELISARANTAPGTPYKFTFLYGYIEARLKIVNVSGFFGAFWMLPDKNNYIAEWEIDILEVLGHDHRTMFQTYHYRPGLPVDSSRNTSWTPNQGSGNNGTAPVLDYSTAYHTYGVDWQPDHFTYYIDGIASGTFPFPGVDNSNIPRTPGYVLIQQMVENSWTRATGHRVPDSTSSVDTFHVDYVRVWQGTPGIGIKTQAPGEASQARVVVLPNPAYGAVAFTNTATVVLSVTIFNGQNQVVQRITARHPVWNGTNEQGSSVKPGLYFYSVLCNGVAQTGKIIRLQ